MERVRLGGRASRVGTVMPDSFTDVAALVPMAPFVLLAYWCDKQLNESGRQRVAALVWSADWPGAAAAWVLSFNATFDSVFGEKHWSWRCFRRSALASVVVVTTLGLSQAVPATIGAEESAAMGIVNCGHVWSITDPVFYVSYLASLGASVLADYLSLLQTRRLLGLMRLDRPAVEVLGIVAFDVVLTFSVTVAFFLPVLVAVRWAVTQLPLPVGLEGGPLNSWRLYSTFWSSVTWNTGFYGPGPGYSMGFFSGFFTSAWLWVYVVGGLLTKALLGMQRTQRWVAVNARVAEHPLFTAALLATVAYMILISVLSIL